MNIAIIWLSTSSLLTASKTLLDYLLSSKISSPNVKPPEMLFGYFIGPFGALLASGIFTSQLQNHLTNVLKLDLGFLTGLQLLSTILIVAANLVVGQLIERTKTLAGKARPWILLAILGAIPMALAATVVVPLANKFGKRQTAFIGMVVGIIGGVIAGLGGSNIIPVAIGVALKCLGSAPACYLILAMLADVIDHIEFTSNIRTDGLTISVYSTLMVAGTPICNAIFSGILGVSGYNQSADVALNTMGQSAAAQTAISISYVWVETEGYAICALLIFLWTVEKNLPEEQAAIAQRKKS